MTVRTAEIVMAVLMALASIGIMVKSTDGLAIGWIPGSGPGSGAWPFWLSTLMLLSCIATIVRWFARITPESRSDAHFMSRQTLMLIGITVAALLALLIGTHFVGLYISLIGFLFFYLRIMGRHSWTVSLSITLLTPVVIFGFFEWALKIPLPKAISEPLFYPVYDLIY